MDESLTIGDILKNELLLSRILEFIPREDLSRCRLVCHLWRRVCDEWLIRFYLADSGKLPLIAKLFPNLQYLHILRTSENPTETDFQTLASLKRLRHLQWKGFANVTYPAISSSHNDRGLFSLLENLISLDLSSMWVKEELFYDSIRYLTSLTSLRLNIRGLLLEVEPFVELSSIQRLQLNSHGLCNHNRNLLFPSLTSLTRLEITALWDPTREDSVHIAEYLGHYATSIRSLSLEATWDNVSRGLTMFKYLVNLRTFEFTCGDLESSDFFAAIEGMESITELRLKGMYDLDLNRQEVVGSIMSLKNLKSLYLSRLISKVSSRSPFSFLALSQLTTLTLFGADFGSALSGLKQLVRLTLHINWETSVEVQEAVHKLSNLETLAITCYAYRPDPFDNLFAVTPDEHNPSDAFFAGDYFTTLTKLKSLELRNVALEDDFFQNLSAVTSLKELYIQFNRRKLYSVTFLQQLELLCNLEDLSLDTLEHIDPRLFMCTGKFDNLRTLRLRNVLSGHRRSFNERFPLAHLTLLQH